MLWYEYDLFLFNWLHLLTKQVNIIFELDSKILTHTIEPRTLYILSIVLTNWVKFTRTTSGHILILDTENLLKHCKNSHIFHTRPYITQAIWCSVNLIYPKSLLFWVVIIRPSYLNLISTPNITWRPRKSFWCLFKGLDHHPRNLNWCKYESFCSSTQFLCNPWRC